MLLLRFAAVIPFIAFFVVSPPVQAGGCGSTCELADHNRLVLTEYIVNNNTMPLDESAMESFFVVTPAGIESRDHVLSTNANLDVTELEVFTHRIEVAGDTAVLAGKIVGKGTLNGRPMPDLGFLTVYTMIDDEWMLMARSLVPLFAPGVAASGNSSAP